MGCKRSCKGIENKVLIPEQQRYMLSVIISEEWNKDIQKAGWGEVMKKLNEASQMGAGFARLLKGVAAAYIATVAVFIVFAFILTYTNFPDRLMPSVVVVGTIVSILIAGTLTARGIKSKGWLSGAQIGFAYMLILYILSSIFLTGFGIDRYILLMLLAGIISGAIGGIAGINLSGRR